MSTAGGKRKESTSKVRAGGHGKKARFKDVPSTVGAEQSSSSGSQASVQVDTINIYSTADGRLGHRSERRHVAVNPAELVFRLPESEDEDESGDPGLGSYPDPGDSETRPVDTLDAEGTNLEGNMNPVATTHKRSRVDLRAVNKLLGWLPFRSDFLDEILRYEASEEPIEEGTVLCYSCNQALATVRCRDCARRALSCETCLKSRHEDLPLHRLEKWDGFKFGRCSLRDIGYVVQLGHNHGTCPNPSEKPRRVVVGDITGVQAVSVLFCECLDSSCRFTPEWCQLLRYGWFPATTHSPATAFTLQLLDTFHELSFQAKTNLYDFWKTIERLTDNSGGADVFDRYKQLSHAVRLWRHLVMLKRFGRAHHPAGPAGTQPGELVVECPACPHPGKNLPQGWETAPPDVKWLYTLFLMIDANFRAKSKDRGFNDIELAPGWAYYVEETKYQAHVKKARARKRKETYSCSAEHNAILQANQRREGYLASGLGAVLCARHGLVRKNGAGDLQLGEGYANMDYLAISTIIGIMLMILFSYDVVCQWYKHLFSRMHEDFPPEMWINENLIDAMRFAIPKKHWKVHGTNPSHSRFSLNYLPGVGRTYGEGIESHWSHMNPLALSTREMSPGMRHEVYNDHWGAWNWQKVIAFGIGLLRALEESHELRVRQEKAFAEYNATFDPAVVRTWEGMVQAWEADPEQPDPYEEPEKAVSSATVKLELAQEEAREAAQGLLPPHEITPGVFLQVGLELEDQQRALRSRAASGKSISELAEQQEKRNVLMRRVENWFSVQNVHMPMVAALRVPAPDQSSPAGDSNPPKAEAIALWLPSSLPTDLALGEGLRSLREKERRLRMAQIADSLEEVRRARRILAGISDYTRKNVAGTGQRAITRMRNLYAQFEKKQGRSVARYRAARSALLVLDPEGSWSEIYKVLQDADLRGPRSDDPAESFGRYEVSWIWLTPRTGAADSRDTSSPERAEEFQKSMRLEWVQSRARAARWRENEELTIEEMRRVLEYCQSRALWWRQQKGRRMDIQDDVLQRGLAIYAEKQASVFERLAARSASFWITYLGKLGALPAWILPYQGNARKVRPRAFKSAMGGSLDPEDIEAAALEDNDRNTDEDED